MKSPKVQKACVVLLAFFLIIGAGVIGFIAGQNYSTETAVQSTSITDNTTVYVTSAGTKYHILKNCPSIANKKTRSITAAEAKKKKYTPCKICTSSVN